MNNENSGQVITNLAQSQKSRRHQIRRLSHQLASAQIRPWLIPLVYALAAVGSGYAVPRFAAVFLPKLVSTMSVGAAIGIYSAIASGMIALTGIVFSLAFVMVQFSASAYSPRLVLWVARDPAMSHALGIFTATFLYALTALAWVDRSNSARVPLISLCIVEVLLIASIAMFIALIHRMGMLQVNRMLVFTGDQGRAVISALYPSIDARAAVLSDADIQCIPASTQTVLHHGTPRVFQAADFQGLMQLATVTGSVIEVVPAIGDILLDSMPLIRFFGGNHPIPKQDLLGLIELGSERTFEQDPKYAIRLLVDIALKALSPAINDPTTAVQALDQIEDLLLRLGMRRLEIGVFRDEHGEPRVLIAFPAWEDFLRLAFDEIRFCGAHSVQVMRRMKAVISELISLLPDERHAALTYWQVRLQATIDRSFDDTEDKLEASTEDRQGLGITREMHTHKIINLEIQN